MNPIDYRYTRLISGRLERFSEKAQSPYRANFRCPFCGDSKKSKIKARGWILETNNHAYFCCHNGCGNMAFGALLERVDPELHKEWIVERTIEKYGLKEKSEEFNAEEVLRKEKTPVFKTIGKDSPLSSIKKISALKHDHPAKKYVESRLIPSNSHYRLYYAPKFKKWTNTMIENKFDEESLKHDEPRLILPFVDKQGFLFGFQGRSFDPKAHIRYITIMINEKPKLFGFDQVDTTKKYYVLEGPIDSLFIKNAGAMAGSSFDPSLLENGENAVFVFDNEPRKPEIIRKMEYVIDAGYSICIWSTKIKQKDVNDMVLKGGYNPEKLQWMIDQRTYSGLEAKLELQTWKGVNSK